MKEGMGIMKKMIKRSVTVFMAIALCVTLAKPVTNQTAEQSVTFKYMPGEVELPIIF